MPDWSLNPLLPLELASCPQDGKRFGRFSFNHSIVGRIPASDRSRNAIGNLVFKSAKELSFVKQINVETHIPHQSSQRLSSSNSSAPSNRP
jgi:hypothetical protein